jgi:hypothetical protein
MYSALLWVKVKLDVDNTLRCRTHGILEQEIPRHGYFQCRIGKPGTGERNVGKRFMPSEPT